MTPEELQASLQKSYHRRKVQNYLICGSIRIAAYGVLIPLFSILFYVISQGVSGLNVQFFTELPVPVGEIGGGMGNAILGSITVVALASLIGVPIGVVIGIFLSEYKSSRIAPWVRFGANLLSSIPSIIIGLFIYSGVVLFMKRFSAFAGALALSIIIIPTLARSTEEILKMISSQVIEPGLALGLPRWRVILQILLAGSIKPIMTGVILTVARAAGETAPLLFTALGNQFWQSDLDQPIATLPVQIYNYATSPFENWHRQAWTGALVLIFLVFGLNLFSRILLRTHPGESQ
jgi:phosphate transport system permease protein